MGGFSRYEMLRVIPQDGLEQIFLLPELLTDLRGPASAQLDYQEVTVENETINHRLGRTILGYRPIVYFDMVINTMADQQHLATIMAALRQPTKRVLLSLDGGAVEREVTLQRGGYGGPDPINGKVFVGARFRLGFACRDLVDDVPAMMTDPGGQELRQDPSFESWETTTILFGWTMYTAGGGNFQSSSNVHTGAYCWRLTSSSAALVGGYQTIKGLIPGTLGRLQIWGRTNSGTSSDLGVLLYNNRTGYSLNISGVFVKDVSFTTAALIPSLTTTYSLSSLDFRVPTTYLRDDIYTIEVQMVAAPGVQLFMDDLSLCCPVLGAGVATW